MKPDELLSHALSLSSSERAKLGPSPLRSLDDSADDEEELTAEWSAELVRRSQEVKAGKIDLIDWVTVHAEALARCRNQ